MQLQRQFAFGMSAIKSKGKVCQNHLTTQGINSTDLWWMISRSEVQPLKISFEDFDTISWKTIRPEFEKTLQF